MPFRSDQIVAFIIAVSFAAGLNVPGTVATLGLLAHFDMIALPAPLALVADWWVIGPAAGLFAFEFIADKIPGFDLIWNALQTFIRVPAGALLAWSATASLSPTAQMAAVCAGAAISLVAHGGKLALRGAVSASPEPFSNVVVSGAEDAVAIGLTWVATAHPFVAAAIALVLMAVIVLAVRWAVRALSSALRGTSGAVRRGP